MADLSTELQFDAPLNRVGQLWTLTARACTAAGGSPTLALTLATGMSETLQARYNLDGTWGPWVDVFDDVFYSTPVPVAAARCISYQLRGTSTRVGSFTVQANWTVGLEVASSTATLRTVASSVTTPTVATRTEGVTCLGVGEYTVRVVARKTPTSAAYVVGDLEPYSGNWTRQLNSTTDANVRVAMRGADGRATDCCDVIQAIRSYRHELEFYRGRQLVWAGPIIDKKADPRTGQVDITAKDLSVWWNLRKLLRDFSPRQVDLASIFEAYVQYSRIVDDYGLDVETLPTGILGDRTVEASALLDVSNELQELARTGVDWTVVNRLCYVGGITINGQNYRIPTPFTDESFRDPPITRASGTGMGNDWYAKGRSVTGHYGAADSDGVLIQRSHTEQSIEDQGSADASARTSWDKGHVELAMLEGDNALDPKAEVDIQELVPGVEAAINVSGGGCVPLNQVLRLERVSTNFSKGTEEVSVYMQPLGSVADDNG